MGRKNQDSIGGTPQADIPDSIIDAMRGPLSRRDFLNLSAVGTLGLVLPQILCVVGGQAAATPQPDAKFMVVAQPTRCTGCSRCELACSAFNDGRAQPAVARIKVNRNLNFGPEGAQQGFWRTQGQFGNFRVIQDTCRQCAHPIPCACACPNGAIRIVEPTNARVVDIDKCTGCRQCQAACPWGMTSFDKSLNKATKCYLCNGSPECVRACPMSALSYVAWQDRGRDIPQRWVVPAYLSTPPSVASTCNVCHK